MKLAHKLILITLIVLNVVVLLGQVWPEGAPPFAQKVNITFLIFTLIYFVFSLQKDKE